MSSASGPDDDTRHYPFGLSSRQLFVFVVLVGLIGPGLVVAMLEQANLSTLATFVWITGYGTTVFVVWYIWLRPIDLVGAGSQEVSRTDSDDTDPSSNANATTIEANEGGDSSDPIDDD